MQVQIGSCGISRVQLPRKCPNYSNIIINNLKLLQASPLSVIRLLPGKRRVNRAICNYNILKQKLEIQLLCRRKLRFHSKDANCELTTDQY